MKNGLDNRQLGSSLVEFSLAALVFFTLVFGIIEGGLGVWTYNNLAGAVREGARYAIVRGTGTILPSGVAGPTNEGPVNCNALTNEVVAPIVCSYSFALDPARLQVTVVWPQGNDLGDPVLVNGLYQFTPFTGFTNINLNLQSQAEVRIACCDNTP